MSDDNHDHPTGTITPVQRIDNENFLGLLEEYDGTQTIAVITTAKDAEADRFGVVKSRADGSLDVVFPYETRSGKGPAKVNTQAFRDGWDRIFGKQAPGDA